MAQKPGTPPVIGVIGGSGIYEIDGLKNAKWRRIESPFGEMSDDVLCGELEDQPIIFLPSDHYIERNLEAKYVLFITNHMFEIFEILENINILMYFL